MISFLIGFCTFPGRVLVFVESARPLVRRNDEAGDVHIVTGRFLAAPQAKPQVVQLAGGLSLHRDAIRTDLGSKLVMLTLIGLWRLPTRLNTAIHIQDNENFIVHLPDV